MTRITQTWPNGRPNITEVDEHLFVTSNQPTGITFALLGEGDGWAEPIIPVGGKLELEAI